MPGEERLPEEPCRRVGMSRSLRGKEVREDDPIEYFFPTGVGSTFKIPEGVMAIEVTQNEEIYGGGENGGKKGVGSAICRRRANEGSTNVEKRKRGGVV